MRMSVSVKERKISQSAPSKIDSIVRQLFVPMLGMSTPAYTSFMPEDCEETLLRQVSHEKPDSMGSEAAFIECMVQLYRKFQSGLDAGESALPVSQQVENPDLDDQGLQAVAGGPAT
jgi:hypothetical protein